MPDAPGTLLFYPKPVYQARYESWGGAAILLFGFVLSALLCASMLRWTRRAQARSSLRAWHNWHSTPVFESHPAAAYSIHLEGRILNSNAQASSEFRISKTDLIGKPFDLFIVPDKQQEARERFDEARQGHAVSYNSSVTADGGPPVEVSVMTIPMKSGSDVVSVLVIAQNITAQKKREGRLQQARKMLQLVIDSIPQRVFWKDTNFVYLGCNKVAAADAGVAQPKDIIGRTDFDLSWKESAALVPPGRYRDLAQRAGQGELRGVPDPRGRQFQLVEDQ